MINLLFIHLIKKPLFQLHIITMGICASTDKLKTRQVDSQLEANKKLEVNNKVNDQLEANNKVNDQLEVNNQLRETKISKFRDIVFNVWNETQIFTPDLEKLTVPQVLLDTIPQDEFDKLVWRVSCTLKLYLMQLNDIIQLNTLFNEIESIRPFDNSDKLQSKHTIKLLQILLTNMNYGKLFIENNISELNKSTRMVGKKIHYGDLTIPFIRFANLS